MTVQLSYRVLRVYVPFTAFNFNEEMNSFKGMGVLNVTADKKAAGSSPLMCITPSVVSHTL